MKRKLQNADARADHAEAKRAFEKLHRELMDLNPSAARSLEEGGFAISGFRKIEVNRLPLVVDGPEQNIHRLATRTYVSSMNHVTRLYFTCPCNRLRISGAYARTHRHTVVWSTWRPRSAMSSSTSRGLSVNRKYHRTHVTITVSSN